MHPTDSLAYKISKQIGYYKNRRQLQNIIQQKPEYRILSTHAGILSLCQDIHTKARVRAAYPVRTGILVFGHKVAGSWS